MVEMPNSAVLLFWSGLALVVFDFLGAAGAGVVLLVGWLTGVVGNL